MSEDRDTPEVFDPEAEDFFDDEIARPAPGPLEGKPGYSSFLPVALAYFVIVMMSGIYWMYPSARPMAVSYRTAVMEGHWWQTVTALGAHSDFLHLLSNTPMFLVFGYLLRGYFGPLVFPLACIIAGVLANLLTVMNMPPQQYLVGMSGMIYAMVAMWMTFYLRFETKYPFGFRSMRASAVSLVLMFPTTYNPNTSYQAHAWGFLLGIALGVIISQFLAPRSIPPRQI